MLRCRPPQTPGRKRTAASPTQTEKTQAESDPFHLCQDIRYCVKC